MPFLIRIAAWSALLALPAGSALAQPSGAATRSASAPASGAASSATSYRSAFEAYRAYGEQPVESWRAANDLVGRIGGWQSYARESQGAAALAPAKAASAPAASASAAPKGHSGYKMP
jgi:hypothetical protein